MGGFLFELDRQRKPNTGYTLRGPDKQQCLETDFKKCL